MGQAIGSPRAGGGILGQAFDQGCDRAQRGAVKSDEKLFAEEKIELGGGKFFLPGKIYGMRDEEEIIFVILNFR